VWQWCGQAAAVSGQRSAVSGRYIRMPTRRLDNSLANSPPSQHTFNRRQFHKHLSFSACSSSGSHLRFVFISAIDQVDFAAIFGGAHRYQFIAATFRDSF
jgi:hypothetical protein